MPLPGLVPQNIRLPGLPEAAIPMAPDVVIEADNADAPEMNDNDPILRIEHEDGSISISMDGKSLVDQPGKAKGEWFSNLVEDIDQGALGSIADDLLRGIEDDIESRRDWIEGRAQGIKLLGLKLEIPGIAGGADVILIPEIPYDIRAIADFLNIRRQSGKRFSIIAVAEGAKALGAVPENGGKKNGNKKAAKTADADPAVPGTEHEPVMIREPMVNRIVRELQALTGVEARMTQLGHVQRGGTPTPADRLLCTRLGTAAGELIVARHYNVMVGVKGDACVPVPLDQVAGVIRTVPVDHPWIRAARLVGTSMGDRPN